MSSFKFELVFSLPLKKDQFKTKHLIVYRVVNFYKKKYIYIFSQLSTLALTNKVNNNY